MMPNRTDSGANKRTTRVPQNKRLMIRPKPVFCGRMFQLGTRDLGRRVWRYDGGGYGYKYPY